MSAERYRVTEYQHSGLDFLQIERGGSTHELCAQTDDSMIVGAIRQQSADIDQLRARLASPAHAHLDGEHLNGMVDGCLLCQAITERDQLRAELAAAVAERDRIKGDHDEAAHFARHFIRDDPGITPRGAIIRLGDKCTELFVRLQQVEARLASIDAAPVVATVIDIGDECGENKNVSFRDYKLPPIGTELIARPAKD